MLATPFAQPFERAGWVSEMKYDGFRALGIRRGEEVRLVSRRGNDLGACFPEIIECLRALPDLILDGELVVLDEQGRPRFDELSRRARMSRPTILRHAALAQPAVIFAFDILELTGKDMRNLPLLRRRKHLQNALRGSQRVRAVEHVGEGGLRLFDAASALGIEGVVAKRVEAPYRRGRSRDWLKILTPAGRAVQAERAKWDEAR